MNKYKELHAVIGELINSEGIGLVGHRVSNGADYYQCPSCFKTINAQGYCSLTAPLTELEHSSDCSLIKLNKLWLEIEQEVSSD